MALAPQQKQPTADDGWETVNDPTEIQKVLGKQGANKVLGLTGGGGAGGGGKAPTEGERKAAFLATRLAGGLSQLKAVGKSGERPGLFEAFVRGTFGDTAANYVTGADRQRAEAAQSDMLDAALTLGTGAAYTGEQIAGYRKAYFPQLGDSDATVADKRKRLNLLLDAAKIGAGNAAPQVQAALSAAGFAGGDAKGGDQQSGAGGAAAAATGNGTPPTPPGGPAPGDQFAWNDSREASEQTDQQKRDQEYVTAVQAAFNAGGGLAELNAIADKFGQPHWEGNETLAKALELRKQGKGATFSAVPREAVDISADRGKSELGDDIKAFARGVPGIVGLDDEANALADVVLEGKDWGEALEYNRAIRDHDEENNFWARLGGGLAAGAVIPTGIGSSATRAALAAARTGVGRDAALTAGARAAGVRGAQEGAALGGAYGVGATDGDLGDRLFGGASGAVLGAVTGGALGYAGSRLATRGGGTPRPPTEGQEVLAAADRQNIIPFAPDVGGPVTRLATAGTAQTLGGVGPVRRAAQATLDSAEAVRDRVAQSFGAVENPEAAGEAARAGANAFIARTSTRGNMLYRQAETAAGGATVEAPNAIRFLEEQIAPLVESGVNTGATGVLNGLRDILSQPRTVRGLRSLRTQIRDQFEELGLRGNNAQRIANRTMDILTDDITDGLRAQGLDAAARAYGTADRYWRNRLATIDDALEPILGANTPKSGEQVVQALKQSMAGNNRRFATFMNALPAEEQGTVRASLIGGLGRATKGNQDETGEAFSLATFLTHWNEIGESAKRTLFGDEARAALNDLAIVARGSKQAQRFANTSNTGAAVTTAALGASALTGAGLVLAAKVLAGQYAAGRLLASPRFARWVGRMPRNPNPAQGRAYIGRLSRIARAEPAIANDVIDLQRRLADAFANAPTRAAAGQEEQQ